MKKPLLILFIAFVFPLITGYLPGNWSVDHAKDDVEKSDAVAIGRIIKIELSQELIIKNKTPDGQVIMGKERVYVAVIRIAKVYKGGLSSNDEIKIVMGYDLVEPFDPATDLGAPSYPTLTMANSQQGYDMRINQVYLLFLSKSQNSWDLRSGPYSIGWLQPGNTIQFGAIGQKWGDLQKWDKYRDILERQLK